MGKVNEFWVWYKVNGLKLMGEPNIKLGAPISLS